MLRAVTLRAVMLRFATDRAAKRLGLLALSTLLLSLSFAPYNQFYLAWIGLVPWLIVVLRARSIRAAALWGGVGGLMFNGISTLR